MIPGSSVSGFFRTRDSQYQIERSLRFNDDDTPNLTRTPGSASGRTQWTFSCWFKSSGKSGAAGTVDSNIFSAGTDGSNYFFFALRGDGTIRIANAIGGSFDWSIITTAVYRDPTAWYNFVIQYDSTQGTASDRVKLYVNGVQVTSFSAASYPSASYESWINSTATHYIGRRAGGPGATEYADGYLTEVNHISGSTPVFSSFGQTNSTTGAWDPKAYSGTYGTNGFFLKFADNTGTTATTLGKDSSGNGNNWTPNNFSVTAGAGNDSLTDTPTNYGSDTGVGGEVRGNYCTLNSVGNVYVAPPTLANGGLDWSTSGTDCAAIGTLLMQSGKWYFEATINSFGGAQDFYLGIFKSSGIGATPYSSSSRLYYRDGRKYDGSIASYGNSYTAGDVIGVAVDMTNGKVFFSKNGTWQNSSDPAAGTNAAFTDLAGSEWLPMGLAGSLTHSSTWNFGQRAFAYTAPTGFEALCTQNLTDSAVVKPTTGFYAKTRTGTGATYSVTGIPFAPNLVWSKGRSGATDHALYDTDRGVQKRLESNNNDAEVTGDSTGLTAFNSDGYTGGALAQINTNTAAYIDWFWREGATYGFDIVLYTGTGSAHTEAHSLGAVPYLMIFKCRSTAAGWPVYHASVGATKYTALEDVAASATSSTMFNDTAPTSSVFSVGTHANTNGNTQTFVAYLWAPVAGFSVFGSYATNNSSDGPFVALGFRSAWLLRRSTANNRNWQIDWRDAANTSYNGNRLYFNPNASGSESNGAANMDICAAGFKVRNTNSDENGASETVIYGAFAQDNFKNARAS